MKEIKIMRLNENEKKEMGIPDEPRQEGPWGVWECGPSAFPWHYDDTEKAYLYEGRVKVITDAGTVEVQGGDFVIFPAGMDCRWEVMEKVKKVYKFE